MSLEQTSNAQSPQVPQVLSARHVWLTGLLRPSLTSYAALARQPSVSAARAYMWVFLAGLLSGVITLLSTLSSPPADPTPIDALMLASLALSALIAVCYLAAFAWCAQVLARWFKGAGTYRQLAFVCAAFSAPLLIVASLLDALPPARVLLIALYVYWLALYVLAVRAVHGISRWRAIACVLAALVIVGVAWLGVAFLVGYSGILLP